MKINKDYDFGDVVMHLLPILVFVGFVVILPAKRDEQIEEVGQLVSAVYTPSETKLVYGPYYSLAYQRMMFGPLSETIPERGETKIRLDSGAELVSNSAAIAKRLAKEIEPGSRVSVIYKKIFFKALGEDEKLAGTEIKEVNLLK